MKILLFALALIAVYHRQNAMADTHGQHNKSGPKYKATLENTTAEISAFSDSEKIKYISEKKDQLSDLAVDVIDLKNQSYRTSIDASKEARARVEKIRFDLNELSWNLNAFENAPAGKWQELINRYDQSFDKVKKSLKDNKAWMSQHLQNQANSL